MFPETENSPVLRTDFSDQQKWEAGHAAIDAPVGGGVTRARVDYIDDPAYADLTPEQILPLLPEDSPHPILVVVDATTLASPEMPLLVVDLWGERGRELRCVPDALWVIESNTSIGNMDFVEFADAVGDIRNVVRCDVFAAVELRLRNAFRRSQSASSTSQFPLVNR